MFRVRRKLKKAIKYTIWGVVGVVVLLITLVVAIIANVDPNDYKDQIIQLVKEKKQRTLTIEGDIKLALFPKIGVELGKTALSQRESAKEFAAINGAKIYVSIFPLLHKEFVVDEVKVDGLRVNLIRYKDGKTNFDDLLQKEEKKAEDSKSDFNIDGLSITNSDIDWRDEMQDRHVVLSKVNLKTGKIANKTPSRMEADFNLQSDQPKVNSQNHIASQLFFDLDNKHFEFANFDTRIKGEAAGIKDLAFSAKGSVSVKSPNFSVDSLALSGSGKMDANDMDIKLDLSKLDLSETKFKADKFNLVAKLKSATQAVNALFEIPAIEGPRNAFQAPNISLDLDAKDGDNQVKTKLTAVLKGNIDARRISLNKIVSTVGVTSPKLTDPVNLNLTGDAAVDAAKENASLDFITKFDDSNIKGKLGLNKFSPPAYAFDIYIDQIDADRYLKSTGKKDSKLGEDALDFSLLKGLNLNGLLRIGKLKVANIKSTNVKLDMKASNGKLDVSPMAMNLYDGSTSGSMSINANTNQVSLKQDLKAVNVNALAKDAFNKDIIEGKGSVALNVTTQGNTTSSMLKQLDGNMGLNLANGALKGINLIESLRKIKNKAGQLKGEEVQEAETTDKTSFSEFKANFDIKKGVAQNNDFLAKSKELTLGGAGNVNLAEQSVDYSTKLSLVNVPDDLKDLQGLVIPVKISGPLTKLGFKMNFNDMVASVAKKKVEAKKEQLKDKVDDKVKDKLKGLLKKK
jgi:AsmA protein